MPKAEPVVVTPEKIFGANPKQFEAWTQGWEHQFLLYGGAAGGGKSFFLRWWCVFYLMALAKLYHVPRAVVGLFCEDYPSLEDRHISKIRTEFPPSLGTFKESKSPQFTLRPEYGGGRILLRNLDDPSKYLSTEFAGAAVDELTRNPVGVFDFLRLRLRWPGIERPCFVAATNPGGIGGDWVKKYWIKEPRELPHELEPFANEFYFVQAKAQDNPFLPSSYHKSLESLPPSMRAAYAEGNWDRFEGQYFNVFDRDVVELTYDAFEALRASQPWQPIWISFDWGKDSHHSYVSWHTYVVLPELAPQYETGPLDNKATIQAEMAKAARGEDGTATLERAVVITYRERLVKDLSEEALAEQIWDWTPQSERKQVKYIWGSKDLGLSGELDGGIRMSSVFTRRGWPPLQGAFNNRVSGWQVMYDKLRDVFVRADMPHTAPWPEWLIVGEVPGKKDFGCPLALRAIPWAMADPDHEGDIIKKGDAIELDVLDGLRYGIASYARMSAKPLAERRREAIAAAPLQARHSTGLRFDLEQRGKTQPFYINGAGSGLAGRWGRRRRH